MFVLWLNYCGVHHHLLPEIEAHHWIWLNELLMEEWWQVDGGDVFQQWLLAHTRAELKWGLASTAKVTIVGSDRTKTFYSLTTTFSSEIHVVALLSNCFSVFSFVRCCWCLSYIEESGACNKGELLYDLPSPASFWIMVPWWCCLVVGGGLPLVHESYDNLGSASHKYLQNPQGLVHSDQKQDHPGPMRTLPKPLDLSNLYQVSPYIWALLNWLQAWLQIKWAMNIQMHSYTSWPLQQRSTR